MTEIELENYYDELLDLSRRVFGADKTAAEDVVSDTILSALADIRAGKIIENPTAYLKTLFYRRNNDFLRRKYRDSCVIFDDGSRLSLIPERNSRENSWLDAEYSRVRQSLSRLNYIYREVMVRHYMRGESVEKVATELEIPVGTVKRRLNSGRKLVREKLDMLQTKNSELSYSPLPLTLTLWGRTGRNNEPFTLVNSLLSQNILVAAYEKPLDAGAIADSLGVAAPYVENELERLVRGELMGKTPGGLCYTRAFILKKSDSYGDIEAQEELAREILEPLAGSLGRFDFPGLSGKALETMKLFSLYTLTERLRELAQDELRGEISLPERPNGGNWLAIGQIEDKSFPKYDSSGPAQTARTSKNGCGMVFDFQSAFGDTHWAYGRLTQPMSLLEARDLFLDLAEGRTPDSRLLENLPDLKRLHIVKRDETSTNLTIPVISNADYAKFCETTSKVVNELFDEVGGKIKKLIGARKPDIPKTVDEREAFAGYSAARILPLAVIFAAVEAGIIDAKIGETPIIVVVTG
mgnify:CR=1 FL=1